jgi:hypothetical protein
VPQRICSITNGKHLLYGFNLDLTRTNRANQGIMCFLKKSESPTKTLPTKAMFALIDTDREGQAEDARKKN